MLTRQTILFLLLFSSTPLYAQIDRATFQRMTPEKRFSFMNEYMTQHWWEFYDSIMQPVRQSARLSEYRFMQSVAKDPKTISFLRVFWCRNQQLADFYCGLHQQAIIDSIASIRTYAHEHHLQAEEGILWLVWCRAMLDQRGAMPIKQRQKLAYAGALRGMALLENLPISVAHQYHRAIYDITHHLWWMSMYFFRIEEYELARRITALGNRLAHPQLDTMEGHAYGYRFYKWEFLNLLGSCHLRLGDLKQALVCYQEAYAFARSQNDQLRQDVSYSNIGVVLQQQGKAAFAEPYLKRAVALAQTVTTQQPTVSQLSEDHFQVAWYDKAYQFDQERFQRLAPDERVAVMDNYLTKNWRKFYYTIQNTTRQTSLVANYQAMRSAAKDPKSATFLRVFWVRNQQYLTIDRETSHDDVLDSLVAIRAYAHQHKLQAEEGICWLAWCKRILEQPTKMAYRTRRILVYDGAVKGLNLLEKLPVSTLHRYNGTTYDLTRHLWWMSMYFYQIDEYDMLRRVATLGYRCVHPLLDAKPKDPLNLEDRRSYVFYKWHFQDDLGAYYLHTGQLSQAETFYRQAYAFAKANKSSTEEGVSYGNIGVALSKQGKWAAALPYLEQAIQLAQQDNNRVSAFKAIVPLADVYLKLNQYDKAFPTLQRAMALYDPGDMLVPEVDSLALIPLFAGLGEVYQHRGDLKKALYYTQQANRLEEKRRQNNEARIFRQKKEEIEAEAYRAKLDQIDGDRQWAVRLRNILVAGLVLTLIGFLLYVYVQRRQRHLVEQQLTLLAEQARANTAQLAERQKQDNVVVIMPDAPLPNLNELRQQAILTEADWDRFRQLFERVYPNYLMRLRATYPTLTPAEIRLVCLSRLNLSTKEMAMMLGVSPDTIVKTRYRIRKKADLPKGTDLKETFSTI